MDKKQKNQLAFALFDGVVISLGAVIALVAANLSRGQVFAIIVGLATSTAIYIAYNGIMAGDDRAAIANAGATFGGILLPALPFIFWRGLFALVVLALLLYFVATYVGKTRGRDPKLTHDIYRTVLIVVVMVWLVEFASGGLG